jgi:hypothetical protein
LHVLEASIFYTHHHHHHHHHITCLCFETLFSISASIYLSGLVGVWWFTIWKSPSVALVNTWHIQSHFLSVQIWWIGTSFWRNKNVYLFSWVLSLDWHTLLS